MDISLDNAQRIVSEISSVLREDVNLMDETATIIASTDASRVGDHHRGAERIISERLDGLIITPEDRIPGARPGLNLPIWVEGEIAGVLGITGNPDTFTTPAHVMQKMTEILLRETRSRERAEQHGRSFSRFLQAWLTNRASPSPSLIREGRDVGIDVTASYVVAASQVLPANGQRPTAPTAQAEIDQIAELAVRHARQSGAIAAALTSRIVMLYPFDGEDRVGDVVGMLTRLAAQVRATSTMRLPTGVSSSGVSAPEAADQAEKALGHAVQSAADVHRYDQLTLELLLAATPADDRLAFAERVFGGLAADVRMEAQRTLRAYFDADGSLSRAAAALHIHKNTLTGRLNRIAESTGLDARRVADAAVLWLALEISSAQSSWPEAG